MLPERSQSNVAVTGRSSHYSACIATRVIVAHSKPRIETGVGIRSAQERVFRRSAIRDARRNSKLLKRGDGSKTIGESLARS